MKQCFRVIFRYSEKEIELMSLIDVYFTVINGEDKRNRNHGLNHSNYKEVLKEANQLGGTNIILQKIKALGKELGWSLFNDQHLENLIQILEKRDWINDFTECALYNNICDAQRAANQHGSEYKIEPYMISKPHVISL